jgi:hypothetical protein
MLQPKVRKAIERVQANSPHRPCGLVDGDIECDEGIVGTDILVAILTLVGF